MSKWEYYPNRTDHSSKYGLNQEQFAVDIQNNITKHEEKKREFSSNLLDMIQCDFWHGDNFSLILECLREIKQRENL